MVVARRQGGPDASVPLVLSQRIKATQQCVITFFDCIPVITDMNDRSLDSLKRKANCLWARWHCLWRPDVPLEFLNQLERDLEAAILQLSVRFHCVCVCPVLNPTQANCGAASQPTSQGPLTDSVPQPMFSSFWRNTMRGRKREDMDIIEIQIEKQGTNVSRVL